MTLHILHIINRLSGDGPTRSLLAMVKYSKCLGLAQEHRILALQEAASPLARLLAKQVGVPFLLNPSREEVEAELSRADIVQLHFWNCPENYEFLRGDWPPIRLLIWSKILGDQAPQIITQDIIAASDFFVATNSLTLDLMVFEFSKIELQSRQKIGLVPGVADFDRLSNFQTQLHSTFNVGYIGTVNFAKMHPDYVSMSAAIQISDIRFIVCGGGIEAELKQQAATLGVTEKFNFRGYVENIRSILSILDVFGYPLCPETYATSDKSLQEAMYAGIPPVVFPYGGVKSLVQHQETGLVVENEREYQQAIEYLYHNPQERLKLGYNAQQYIRQHFDGENLTWKMHQIYEQMMRLPKRLHPWPDHLSSETSAEGFVKSLGNAGFQFASSLQPESFEEAIQADQLIARSSMLLAQGEGGIVHYRNKNPQDGFLRFWTGLVFYHKQQFSKALTEFEAAIALGCDYRQVNWFIEKVLHQIDQKGKS